MQTIFVLNGPNLNLLGQREPAVYGYQTLDDVQKICIDACERRGYKLDFRQTNHEGVIVDSIQEAGRLFKAGDCKGLIINAGALTHYSVALHDAIKGTNIPCVELHISNIHAREEWRHKSFISLVAKGIIMGLGVKGYKTAIDALADMD